ncbi:hypothetical protein [Azovibrio restrictus]|uniref:hypothetical protein n=1 Tax=Azovibrio restrictus TaxID=146938 RepID=UPI0026EC572A|nr:hypothetical protein [Azovibrio restrictus]
MKRTITLALLGSLALPGLAQHPHGPAWESGPWTDLPLIQVQADRQERSRARLRLSGLNADEIRVYPPEGPVRTLPLQEGGAELTAGPLGNYHWLQAREESPEQVRIASSVRYFGNPGPAPTAMLEQPKSELEIVPQPLPREHWQYRSGQEWDFLIRFQGQPLANATLHFMSRNGSHAAFLSDGAGRVRLPFPDDWPAEAKAGDGHRHPMTPFVLRVEHEAAGRRYQTSFNLAYSLDPMSGRDLAAGAGFLALGGVLALPLLRRRKEQKEGGSC